MIADRPSFGAASAGGRRIRREERAVAPQLKAGPEARRARWREAPALTDLGRSAGWPA
jgi:hypothetical protein